MRKIFSQSHQLAVSGDDDKIKVMVPYSEVMRADFALYTEEHTGLYSVLKDRWGSGLLHWEELVEMGVIYDFSQHNERASFRLRKDALVIFALMRSP